MTKDERFEQMLSDISLLGLYRFTGSFKFGMTQGAVSLDTLKTLRRFTQMAEQSTDVEFTHHPQEV